MSDDSDSVTTYSLTGERISPKRMRVDTGDAELVVGADANPVEYFLASVLACLNSTATMVARDMDIDLFEMTATVEGGVDYATYRGEETDARPGLQGLTVTVEIEADADEATVEEWLAAVEDRCPITDNVENETSLEIAVETA